MLASKKHRGSVVLGKSPVYGHGGYIQNVCKPFLFSKVYSAKLDMIQFSSVLSQAYKYQC